MFQFPRFASCHLCIQCKILPKKWVSPFRNLRVKGCLPPHRSLSQATTSFIASSCQGIHRVRLVAWLYNPKLSQSPFDKEIENLRSSNNITIIFKCFRTDKNFRSTGSRLIVTFGVFMNHSARKTHKNVSIIKSKSASWLSFNSWEKIYPYF